MFCFSPDEPTEMCQVKIWDQPWKKLRSVTQKSCNKIENKIQDNFSSESQILGDDGHDQLPHRRILGGDGHDQLPHGKVLGGGDHDQVPHGHILGGDGHDNIPHGKILGGDGHDQLPHGASLNEGQSESFDSDPDLGLEKHNIQKKILLTSSITDTKPIMALNEEFMPLLQKPSKILVF